MKKRGRDFFIGTWLFLLAIAFLASCKAAPPRSPDPHSSTPVERKVTEESIAKPTLRVPDSAIKTHPRLFFRQSDLPRLRSWAQPSNPRYENGIKAIAATAMEKMNGGSILKEDPGGNAWVQDPTESYAMFFAFLSLISGSQEERHAHAQRARTLLMHAIDEAAKGPAENQPFRDPGFSIQDRSRWYGAAFPLTVDWIYPYLTAEDKRQIRKVFLRWADELENAATTDYNHPEPVGVFNDPQLLSDRRRVRWAANNYYAAHARNLGLMAMAFDPADDPDSQLRQHLRNVTGAWLYVSDALWRGDMRGGLPAEGFEYSPQALGYIAQLLLALHTAGLADASSYGRQSTYENPFWNDLIAGYFHSLSPAAKEPADPDYAYLGALHAVAWYGDGQKYMAPDFIGVFGPLGLYDQYTGNAKRLDQIRWIQTRLAPGGVPALQSRTADTDDLLGSIFYFLLFDPKAPATETDPRPAYPLNFFSAGLGRFLQRTSWKEDASWFSYKLGWATIDHQSADGNMFEFWRKGEWLTKERTGYGFDIMCTDQKNGIALQNNPTAYPEGDYRTTQTKRGSQRTFDADGDGKILAFRAGQDFSYFLGDATQLYNSSEDASADIVHASRSIVWLPPDHIVVYDRAVSKSENRFKRFFLQLPNTAASSGDLAKMKTPAGQYFYVRTLLPSPAAISVEASEPLDAPDRQPAELDPIRFRLRVEAPGNPKAVRWLHLLQGADSDTGPDPAALLTSSSGNAYQGVSFRNIAVMFPVDVGLPFESLTYSAPPQTGTHLITGLVPNAVYQASTEISGDARKVIVKPGGDLKADGGGVLLIGKIPPN